MTVIQNQLIQETLASGPQPKQELKAINLVANGLPQSVLLGQFFDPNGQKVFLDSWSVVGSFSG